MTFTPIWTAGLRQKVCGRFFSENSAMSHFGETARGSEAIESWYDSLKAGFNDSVHMIKNVEFKEFEEVIAVRADVVWTAAFRNMEGNNKIMYKADVRMDLIDSNGKFIIKNYKSVTV